LDSNGKQTYQEAEESFTVKVKDYRARIALTDEAKPAILNVADFVPANPAATPPVEATSIDLTEVLDVWPALGTTGLKLTYTKVPNKKGDDTTIDPNKIIYSTTGGKITLSGKTGMAKVIAKIAAKTDVPDGFEITSFSDQLETDTFVVEVKPGVAYIAGYDATGKEIRKTMLEGTGADEYINLSDKLMNATKTAFLNTDVVLDAGWYFVDDDLTAFGKNIRIQGDVNIILNSTAANDLTLKNCVLMDESAKQNFKLNFYPQKVGTGAAAGAATFKEIKEFKEVNICGVDIASPVNAVENVSIINGTVGALTGIGTGSVDITNATAVAPAWGVGQVSKFATVAINKGTAASSVQSMDNITTATIAEGATTGDLKGITTLAIEKASVGNIGGNTKPEEAIGTLTIDKATSIGTLTNVGTAVITETPIMDISTVTSLTLNKVKTASAIKLLKIGSVTINKTDKTVTFNGIQANALNISDGTIVSNGQIAGFDKNGAADTKVTMTGGKLTVNGPSGAVFAILGDVEVSGEFETGDFYAVSPDHHAVSGALTGKFEGCADNNSWKAITGAERPKYIRNKASE
jgi:hypothetical protein